jgi:hypothetical protein
VLTALHEKFTAQYSFLPDISEIDEEILQYSSGSPRDKNFEGGGCVT